MATCDVCNATASSEEGATYSATEFRELVANGFEPDESAISLMTLFGVSRQQAVAQWKQGLVAQSATNWVLCPSCAARARNHVPARTGSGQSPKDDAPPVPISQHHKDDSQGMKGQNEARKPHSERTPMNYWKRLFGGLIERQRDPIAQNVAATAKESEMSIDAGPFRVSFTKIPGSGRRCCKCQKEVVSGDEYVGGIERLRSSPENIGLHFDQTKTANRCPKCQSVFCDACGSYAGGAGAICPNCGSEGDAVLSW